MTPEGKIKKAFVDTFHHLALPLEFVRGQGWPDKLVIMPDGRVRWIEFKEPGGELSREQEAVIHYLTSIGHTVDIVWTEKTARKLARILNYQFRALGAVSP